MFSARYGLNVISLKPSGHYMCHLFNIHKFYVLPAQCIYVFCVDLRTNSDSFPIQHLLVGFYNRNWVCLLRGTNWVYIIQTPLKPSGYCMYHQFNIHKFCMLPTQCIYVFCVDLRTNSDYFPIQHQLTGFYNRRNVFTARYGLDLYMSCGFMLFFRAV